ncbi:hypothetical protein DB30_03495 [Enhygromyxa salina]|uniref:Uncharacterized protein n=1 Tax=Enhygromyxa salina TaxID=215803 RepID=A0A0C2DC71_9BACT|nr:hypothetical protein DB30_03495 [Enhygromyxa salina]
MSVACPLHRRWYPLSMRCESAVVVLAMDPLGGVVFINAMFIGAGSQP